MSATRLRAATNTAQEAWAATVDRVAATHAARIARIDDLQRANEELIAVLRRETINARNIGARQVSDIVRASGHQPAEIAPRTAVGPPKDLAMRMAMDWEAAESAPGDTTAFREARLHRTIDQALTQAHDAGMADVIEDDDAVIGYRRVSRSGCCGACLALIDGQITRNPRDFPRHPHCRCIPEPVITDVNVDDHGRPTGQERWDTMSETEQDIMFAGHGGREKADLLRDGHINLADLVSYEARRPGQLQIPTETTLAHLRLTATARRLQDAGQIDGSLLQLPDKLTPRAATRELRRRLADAAQATWDAPTAASWALDPHYGYAVTMPDRAFGKIARDHGELGSGAALRARVLETVQYGEVNTPDQRHPDRRLYFHAAAVTLSGAPRWLSVVVEYDGITGEAFNAIPMRALPPWAS